MAINLLRTQLVAVFCVLLVFPATVGAQSTTSIRGLVQDEQRASVPGATVTARHAASGLERFAVSDVDGSFELANLPLGTHDLTVSMPGFSPYQQRIDARTAAT